MVELNISSKYVKLIYMAAPPGTIYTFKAISIEIPTAFLAEMAKPILKPM